MMKLAGKDVKIVMINLINIFYDVKENMNLIMREIEDIKENPSGTSGGGKNSS